jgi:hypothetical protein
MLGLLSGGDGRDPEALSLMLCGPGLHDVAALGLVLAEWESGMWREVTRSFEAVSIES